MPVSALPQCVPQGAALGRGLGGACNDEQLTVGQYSRDVPA